MYGQKAEEKRVGIGGKSKGVREERGRKKRGREKERENRDKNEYTNQNFPKTSQYKDKKRKYF